MHYTESTHRHRGILDPEDFEKHIRLRCYKPSPDLAPYVEHFFVARWDLRGKPDYVGEDVLTQPVVNLFFLEDAAFFNGITPGRRAFRASGRGAYAGIKFKPGGFHPFWPHLLTHTTEASLPATEVFPEADRRFSATLVALPDDQAIVSKLEALLRAQHPAPDHKITLISTIMSTVEADPQACTVTGLAAQFHLSERNLQRLFQEYVGIGIKWSIVRARLLVAVDEAHITDKPNWTTVAAELGYSSQSHLVNDFKRVIGVSPSQYFKSKRSVHFSDKQQSFTVPSLGSSDILIS